MHPEDCAAGPQISRRTAVPLGILSGALLHPDSSLQHSRGPARLRPIKWDKQKARRKKKKNLVNELEICKIEFRKSVEPVESSPERGDRDMRDTKKLLRSSLCIIQKGEEAKSNRTMASYFQTRRKLWAPQTQRTTHWGPSEIKIRTKVHVLGASQQNYRSEMTHFSKALQRKDTLFYFIF